MTAGPVLVTGAAGLLGHWLLRSAPAQEGVVALTHRRPVGGPASPPTDLRDPASVMSTMREVSPRMVIHAAYAKDRSSIVDATQNILRAATEIDAQVVFISSDAVFTGDGVARDESAQPDAEWDYGRWKSEAERAVLHRSANNAVVQLPLLVSIDPDDHVVRQICAGVEDKHPTRWFSDEIRQPVRAADAAAGIWRIAGLSGPERSGVWHLAGAERLSRLEIARRMVERLGVASSAIEPAIQPANTHRPRDISLSDARSRSTIGWDPASIP